MAYWPIQEIRIRTARLELRLPDPEMLEALATLAEQGIHPPEERPFSVPWTDQAPPWLGRGTVQWHLLQLAQWRPGEWSFNPVALHQGRVVGSQGISAHEFAITRCFATGSWLGRAHQGQGLGREMRAAVLHFGFVGLGAREATSGAFADNPASLAVSRSLGYEENGVSTVERRGKPAQMITLRLRREVWERAERPEVELVAVEPCLELFGLGPPAGV